MRNDNYINDQTRIYVNNEYKTHRKKLLLEQQKARLPETMHRVEQYKKISDHQKTLFQKINEMGNYADSRWFTDLSYQELLRFTRELYDIWHYRAELSQQIKMEICPPTGNPFHSITILHLQELSYFFLQKTIISIMESMVNVNSTSSNKHLGSLYILSGLCLVNNSAAAALPWLYQSVVHSN